MPPKRQQANSLSINSAVNALPEVYTPLEHQEYDAEVLFLHPPTSPIECFSYFFNLQVWEVLRDGTNAYYT